MSYDEAARAVGNKAWSVVVHKTWFPTAYSDLPGRLVIDLGVAVTWCPPPVLNPRGDDLPSPRQCFITPEQADELVRLGATDDRDGEQSKQVEQMVMEWKAKHPLGVVSPTS